MSFEGVRFAAQMCLEWIELFRTGHRVLVHPGAIGADCTILVTRCGGICQDARYQVGQAYALLNMLLRAT